MRLFLILLSMFFIHACLPDPEPTEEEKREAQAELKLRKFITENKIDTAWGKDLNYASTTWAWNKKIKGKIIGCKGWINNVYQKDTTVYAFILGGNFLGNDLEADILIKLDSAQINPFNASLSRSLLMKIKVLNIIPCDPNKYEEYEVKQQVFATLINFK